MKRIKATYLFLFSFLLLLLALQFFYFLRIYKGLNDPRPDNFDLVVTYSDSYGMDSALEIAKAHHVPLYLSQSPWEHFPFPSHSPSELKDVHVDPTAATTDQNARRAVTFIKKGGFKRVLLVVEWFHVPRALFLTRLYLLGSGVEIIPYAKNPVPPRWWTDWLFRREIYRFWGSLGRVAFAFLGIETGPHAPKRQAF